MLVLDDYIATLKPKLCKKSAILKNSAILKFSANFNMPQVLICSNMFLGKESEEKTLTGKKA